MQFNGQEKGEEAESQPGPSDLCSLQLLQLVSTFAAFEPEWPFRVEMRETSWQMAVFGQLQMGE